MSVCIVIPVYKERSQLTSYEEISLKQCFRTLHRYPVFFVGPHHLEWADYLGFSKEHQCEAEVRVFPKKFFSGVGAYSRMLVSRKFYQSFSSYKYLLVYQTDAFVFDDQLEGWVQKGYDYVGAPWFEGFSSTNPAARMIGTGNGGFSLRNIQAHLKVLQSFSYIVPPVMNWRNRVSGTSLGRLLVNEIAGFALDLVFRNNTFYLFNSFKGFEDQFWSLVAPKNFKWFIVAGIEDAMNFSIEMQPRRVYKMNGNKLPFGCHAWWKYDFEFWKPHIEAAGHQL